MKEKFNIWKLIGKIIDIFYMVVFFPLCLIVKLFRWTYEK